MSWTMLDDHDGVVAGPFATVGDALQTHHTSPYVRLNKLVDGSYDVEAGFSADDHAHYLVVDSELSPTSVAEPTLCTF